MLLVALVLARVIAESGGSMPHLDGDEVLLIKRSNVQIGDSCDGPDAGPRDDAGAGDAMPADAGPDAEVGDAGVGDAMPSDAGGCEMIEGDAVTLVVQPRFSQVQNGTRFALLMVTPSRPIVETQPAWIFQQLRDATAKQIVEHVTRVEDPDLGTQCASDVGCGAQPVESGPTFEPPGIGDGGLGSGDGGFTVDTVGPYEVLRAEPADAAELESWLTGLGYLTLPADLAAVEPYIARGYTIVAVRVKVEGTSEGLLSPIALTWAGTELRLPVALGSPAIGVPRETTVYIAGSSRYELPGASVPFAYWTSFGSEGFLTKNVIALDEGGSPDDDPVAESMGTETILDVETVNVTRRVPVSDCGDLGCGCRECNAGHRPVRGDWFIVAGVVAFATLRRGRRYRSSRRAAR